MRLHVLMAIQERIGNPFIDKSSYVLSKQGLILIWLVVTGTWIDHFSRHIGNFIIPTDFHSIIFQRGRLTTNQNTLSQSLSSYLTSGYIWSGRPKPLQRPPIVSPGGFPAEICDESVTNPISHGHSKRRWYFRQWIWYKVYEDHSKTKEFEDRKG